MDRDEEGKETLMHRSGKSAQGDLLPVVRGSRWPRWIVTRKAKKR